MKKLQNLLEYALVAALAKIIRILPLSAALWLGRGIGNFFYYIVPIRKAVTIDNIASAFPEKSQRKVQEIARRTYVLFGQNIIEFMRQPRMTKAYLEKHVRFVNADLFEKAHRQGKGTVILSGHFGNWELMGAAIRSLGYPIMAIGRDQRNPLIDRIIKETRAAVGVQTIPLGMALRSILRAMRENKFIALLGDQDAHDEGVFVDFLGRPSATAQGPAVFCLKSGAPMIFGVCHREKNGNHTVYLQQVETSDLEGLSEENIRILTQRHAHILEDYIRRWPDHWFWMHRRWKTKPKTQESKN